MNCSVRVYALVMSLVLPIGSDAAECVEQQLRERIRQNYATYSSRIGLVAIRPDLRYSDITTLNAALQVSLALEPCESSFAPASSMLPILRNIQNNLGSSALIQSRILMLESSPYKSGSWGATGMVGPSAPMRGSTTNLRDSGLGGGIQGGVDGSNLIRSHRDDEKSVGAKALKGSGKFPEVPRRDLSSKAKTAPVLGPMEMDRPFTNFRREFGTPGMVVP
jgi:hypothetical protein